jgi:hypothetical protein
MKCLICDGEVYARGICHGCYSAAYTSIKKGEYTWEQLEVSGMALPARITRKNMIKKRLADLPGQMNMFEEKENEVPNS